MQPQVDEPLVEARPLGRPMCQDCRLLVVHQHLVWHAAEVLEGADQPLVGVLGVLPVGAPEVEAPQ